MSKDKKKPSKIKARLPRGFEDRDPSEINATSRMIDKIRGVYELYGFEALETPAIEYTETLGKFLPDSDRPNEGVFSFQDDDEQWLSLRYDLTAPLARYVAQNFEALPKPYRSYRVGWVFRNEKPGPGRFRQFMQFDADTVGSASPAADAEMCMMAADLMEELGVKAGDYLIRVNNRKILDGVMDAAEITPEQRLTVLRAIDKLDRLGWDKGVKLLLQKGRKDESGDFTKGAQLTDDQVERLEDYLLSVTEKNENEPDEKFLSSKFQVWRTTVKNSKVGNEGISELEEMAKLTLQAGYSLTRIDYSSSVVRGLEYYTGPVFEAEITREFKYDNDQPLRIGSVGGGGRYDGLISRFRGEPVPATGFSIGVSRLRYALLLMGRLELSFPLGPVVVTIFDKDRVSDYQAMVKRLRDAGIRAELYLGNPRNFGNQLKYADRRNSPCAVIQGGDEKAKGEVQIKDLIEGAKAAAAIASNKEWRETRPAQFSVKEEKLVEAVKEVLSRHKRHSH